MRDGRILDSGTPAELIDRHARRATVRFTLTAVGTSLLEQLRRTEGVQDVELSGTRVTLAGDRRLIAHVGAAPSAGDRYRRFSACTCPTSKTPCSACSRTIRRPRRPLSLPKPN